MAIHQLFAENQEKYMATIRTLCIKFSKVADLLNTRQGLAFVFAPCMIAHVSETLLVQSLKPPISVD
jgi:hypothetical protein